MQLTWRPFQPPRLLANSASFGGRRLSKPVDPLASVRIGSETDWAVFERLALREHPPTRLQEALKALDLAAQSADPNIQKQVLGVYNLGSNDVISPQPGKAISLRKKLFPNAIQQSLLGNEKNPFLVWVTREELSQALGLTSESLQYVFEHAGLTVEHGTRHQHHWTFIRVNKALIQLVRRYQADYRKYTNLRTQGYRLKPEIRDDLRPFREEELAGKLPDAQIQDLDNHIRHLVHQGTVAGQTVRVPPGTFPENPHQYHATLIEPQSWEKHLRGLNVEAALKPGLDRYRSTADAAQHAGTDEGVVRKQCERHRLVALVCPSQFANRALQEGTAKGHLYWYIHPASVEALLQQSRLVSEKFIRPLEADRQSGIPSHRVLTEKMNENLLVGLIGRSTYGSKYGEFYIFRPELERIRTNRQFPQPRIGWWRQDTEALARQYASAKALLKQNQFLSLEEACSALAEEGWSLSPKQLTDWCQTGMVEALRLTGRKPDDYFIHHGTIQALIETRQFLSEHMVRLAEAAQYRGFNRHALVQHTSVGFQFLGGNYIPKADIEYCRQRNGALVQAIGPPQSSSRRKSR